MKRLHVHLSVDELEQSVSFYSGLFGAEPTVLKPDYAKWMLEDPRVNFAISTRGPARGLDHLGLQVDSDEELAQMRERLDAVEAGVREQLGAACCYARSDKYWVTDPAGVPWETFHSLETIPVFGRDRAAKSAAGACCAPSGGEAAAGGSGACC